MGAHIIIALARNETQSTLQHVFHEPKNELNVALSYLPDI